MSTVNSFFRLARQLKQFVKFKKFTILPVTSMKMSPSLTTGVDSVLKPPSCVAHLTKLDHNLFRKTITVPYIVVEDKFIQEIAKYLKPQYLTVKGIDTIQCFKYNPSEVLSKNTEDDDHDSAFPQNKMILLNPDLVKSVDDLNDKVKKALIEKYKKDIVLYWKDIELNFGNYNVHDIIDAIFPEEEKRVKSWSIIGHILHVNLRDEKLLHKDLIGQVLLETNPAVSMVINKAEIIDTKFRNFSHEVIASKPDSDKLGTEVTVHSNNCTFRFDFAKVYWNPRLNTEHNRFLVRLDKGRDVVYDMFAGIGPFAVPAAKKNCRVLANDLNPDAFHWLQFNSKANKVDSLLKAYNMDARQFVRSVVRDDMLQSWASPEVTEFVIKPTYHVLMNLPGMAIEFLDAFVGLMADKAEDECLQSLVIPPMIHCYAFLKRDRSPLDAIPSFVEDTIRCELPNDYELKKVRAVAPFKDMFRISFKLPTSVLFDKRTVKKLKIS